MTLSDAAAKRFLEAIFSDAPEEIPPGIEPRICVAVLAPEGHMTLQSVENTGKGLHDLMDGYFEVIQIPTQLAERRLIGLVDEDGNSRSLPPNRFSPILDLPIVGPVVIVKTTEDGTDFVSLSKADQQVLDDWFGGKVF